MMVKIIQGLYVLVFIVCLAPLAQGQTKVRSSKIGDKQDSIRVDMPFDPYGGDQIVELGLSTQKRKDLSGAVSTVTGEVLQRSPVANTAQSFAGRFSGLATLETSSELTKSTTTLFVRGISTGRVVGPLVVVDGIPVSYNSNQVLDFIPVDEIASVSVLKDASTQAIYGIQGANGVIVVTTKRGYVGKTQINTRLDYSIQEPTVIPRMYSSAEYAEMRNLAAANDGRGDYYAYKADEIERFRSGQDPLYPSTNWYEHFVKPQTSMQRIGVNVTGGNDRVKYFSNVNFLNQAGLFKTDQSVYNVQSRNIWANVRSNVDIKLNKYLDAFVRLSGNFRRENMPGNSSLAVYQGVFQLQPTMYGPLTPEIINPETGEVTDPGGKVITTQWVNSPAYGLLNRSGYSNRTVTNINSQFGLNLNLDFLLEGLAASSVFAYQTNSIGDLRAGQDYERWQRSDDKEKLTFTKKGSQMTTPLAYSKNSSNYYHLTYQGKLNYSRDFNKHRISSFAYLFYQNLTKADITAPELLPYNRMSSGFEVGYAYDDRYLAKFDLGYSGSEQYGKSGRYTSTPAISLAWVASNESFLKGVSWLNQLKLRGAYGKTANDNSGLGRYPYLDNVTLINGGKIEYLNYTVNERLVANPSITAEVSTKQNIGIDIGLFNGFSASVDLFDERMKNMVVNAVSNIPTYQGIPLGYYPALNSGGFSNKGYEFTVGYSKSLRPDLSINIGGMVSYAKNKVLSRNEGLRNSSYAYRKWQEGFSHGQQFGYVVDKSNGNGFFNSAEELASNRLTYSFGTPRLGDLKYTDMNGDQLINEADMAPLGTGLVPRMVYGFNGGAKYGPVEVNFLFQGISDFKQVNAGSGLWETEFGGQFGSIHENSWTAQRYQNGDPISFPSLSLSRSVNHQSNDFFVFNYAYLRLKNLEIAYHIRSKSLGAIGINSMKILLSGQNLVTWDHVKSSDFGPEGAGYLSFPVYRVYNLGVNIVL